MRKREEISDWESDGDIPLEVKQRDAIIEVLLDIRELLQPKQSEEMGRPITMYMGNMKEKFETIEAVEIPEEISKELTFEPIDHISRERINSLISWAHSVERRLNK